ncbi:DUF2125 domain-containing protein [Halovulum sp. GXIMD14793]
MYASLRAASLTVCITTASVCSAQTTPAELYQELQNFYEMSGMSLVADSTEMDGDTLVLKGLTLDASQPEVEISVKMGDYKIMPIDDPDFDLELVMPETMPISILFDVVGRDDISGSVGGVIKMNGRTRFGGTAEQRVIQSDVESFSFSLDTVDIPELDIPPFDLVMSGSNVGARYELLPTQKSYNYTSNIGDFSISGKMTVEGTTFDLALTERNIKSNGSGPIVDNRDAAAVFGNDKLTVIEATDEGVEMTLTGSGEVPFSVVMKSESGSFDMAFGQGGMDFSGVLKAYSTTVSSAAMPIPPVDMAADTYGFRLAFPLVPYDAPGLTALRLDLDGLTVSESLWSLIDPGQEIPRDPAAARIDITSKSNALYDITDPDAAMAARGMPFRFDDVKLNDLTLRIGGAEITGSGEAEINNDGPFPMPVGGADFRIVGVNGLIEKLIGIDLLQPEQAMPVQMMMGMFAKPGDEPDVFTSRVEMTADGSITANGVPLQ